MKWYFCEEAERFIAYLDEEAAPYVPCKFHYFEHLLSDPVDTVMKLKCRVCMTEQIVPEGQPDYFEEWHDLDAPTKDETLSGDQVIFEHTGLCSVCHDVNT